MKRNKYKNNKTKQNRTEQIKTEKRIRSQYEKKLKQTRK